MGAKITPPAGANAALVNQDVTTGSSPTFKGDNFTEIPDTGISMHGSTDCTLHNWADNTTGNGYLEQTTITDAGGLDVSWLTGNKAFIDGTIIDMGTTGSPKTLDDDATTYMYTTVAGDTTFLFSTTPPTGEFTTRATFWTSGGDIIAIHEEPALREATTRHHVNLEDLHSQIIVSGMEVAVDADGTNANDFTTSPGVYYMDADDRETLDSIFYSAGIGHAESLIHRYYHSSSSWTREDANGVDFGFWDNGTDKTAVNAVKWYSATLVWDGGSGSHCDYVYPQVEHDSESDALAEATTLPPLHEGITIPLASFIFRGNASAFDGTAYFVDRRPFHGGGSGGGTNQNVFLTVSSDSGSTTADSATDTLTIAGGVGVDTSVSGDTLTAALDGTALQDIVPVTIIGADGGVITSGLTQARWVAPCAGTITQATLLLDQSGSIVIDVWKDTYANFPPTDADSITASAPPTVSGAIKSQDATLTGWTKTFVKGDIFYFNVDSVATATSATLILDYTRTGA